MKRSKSLPRYRPGIPRFAVVELDSTKKSHRFSIARIEGKLRDGTSWRVSEDIFTSQQADRVVQQLNRLAQERARAKDNSCLVVNAKTLKAFACTHAKAKTLRTPNLVVD